jgi:DNA-binding transcriptional LysR family regulator
LIHDRVCVAVAPQHPFARRRAILLTDLAAEPLIGLTHEDYPEYYDYLSITFSKVRQKPRVIEEHDSMAGILSSVEAGTGVAIGADAFGYSYRNRVKRLRVIPEPKPISIGIIGPKGRLSPVADKFLQCAKGAVSAK